MLSYVDNYDEERSVGSRRSGTGTVSCALGCKLLTERRTIEEVSPESREKQQKENSFGYPCSVQCSLCLAVALWLLSLLVVVFSYA